MENSIETSSNVKSITLLKKISFIVILTIFISPIITMIAYLFCLDHSVDNHQLENFTELSTLPSFVFSTVICASGMIGFFVTIVYIILRKKESSLTIDKKLLIISLIFFIWIFICDLLASDKYSAFFGDSYRQEGFFTIVSYFGISGCAYITLKEDNKFRFFLRLFVIVSSIIAFLVLLQSFGLYIPFFEYGRPHTFFTGPFMNLNHYGYYLVMGLFAILCSFYLEKNMKIKYTMLALFFLQSYILVINNTFGCYLAVTIGLIFFIAINWIRNGKTNIFDYSFLAILLIASLIALASPYPNIFSDYVKLLKDVGDIASGKDADGAGTSRWYLWKESVKIIGNHPFFGIGSDNGTFEMYNNVSDRPHNEFIQYTLFYGIPGFIMYLSILIIVLFPCLKDIRRISQNTYSCFLISVAYLLSSMFGNTMYYTYPIFLMFLFGCLSQKNNDIYQTTGSKENEVVIENDNNDELDNKRNTLS